MNTKGLFDLSILESAKDDDILNMPINESEQEFANGSEASPATEFDKDATTGEKGPSIPGGDKETPTAKPVDGETGPSIPGGDNEKPAAKPANGESGYSEPKSVTLTADTYNDAIDLLQKSFKEAYEITGMLKNAKIVEESVEDLQNDYMEDLMLESFSDGPIFEAVTKENKKEIKAIVKKIRKPIFKTLQGNGVAVKKVNVAIDVLFGVGGGLGKAAANKAIGNKVFQMLCTVTATEKEYNKILANLNKLFAEELGDYKVLGTIIDSAAASKMDNDTVKNVYLLFVDKEITDDFKRIDKLAKSTVADAKKEDKKD